MNNAGRGWRIIAARHFDSEAEFDHVLAAKGVFGVVEVHPVWAWEPDDTWADGKAPIIVADGKLQSASDVPHMVLLPPDGALNADYIRQLYRDRGMAPATGGKGT